MIVNRSSYAIWTNDGWADVSEAEFRRVLTEYPHAALTPCSRCGAHRWGWAGWALPKSAPSNPAQDMLRCAECNHTARRADLQYPTVGQD